MSNLLPLPIDDHLEAIKKRIDDSSTFFLKASPGCGKTTRLPPYLAHKTNKKIIVLEPRRISARQAAKRIASEQNWEHGQRVGHLFRFENMTSEDTQLCFFTEGTFLRWWQNNPELKDVAYVLIDEFHERHLDTDLALALLLDFQKKVRPDLKIIIMSATLNLDELKILVPDASHYEVDIPLYPVEIKYFPHRPEFSNMSLEKKISSALEEILTQNKIEGDILVFLAGMRDILTAQTYLLRVYGDQFEYQILHGDLTIEEQLKIFTPSMKAKKIILSTNIAESSVTIPSVRIVIDNGEYREIEVSPWTGLKTLKTKRISKASAIQRAGRAQRTGPGICFRLMSEFDYKAMNEVNRPEILREDLSSAYLWAKGLKLEPKWVTTPTPAQIEQANKILFLLGSIEKNGQITNIGTEILNLPLHPRAARILIESFQASALVQKEIVKALAKWLEGDRPDRMENRLRKIIQDNNKHSANPIESIEQCFICGLYDQIIKKRNDFEYVHQSGQVLKARFQTSGKWFLALEIDHLGNIQNMMELPEEWYLELPKDFLQENIQVQFVSVTQRLERLYQLKFNNLVIEESKRQILPVNESNAVQEQIISEANKILQNNLKTSFETEDYQKIKLLINHQGLKANEESFSELLKAFTKNNLLKNEQIKLTDFFGDFKNEIYQHLGLSYKEKIQEYFPSRLKLTNGREIKLDYSTPPHIYGESLLQDFYGIKTHPALFDGKIKITLRLLGPHKRPIQVTSDLITFWKGSYQMVKKEMQSEYPRHHWSDDPVNAGPILLKKNLVKD